MDLVDKIRKIEALIVGAATEGERQAAELAKQRIEGKIALEPLEYTIRLPSSWAKKLFVALCHKYQLRTYRYARQKYTTTMVRVSAPFMNQVLWPAFDKYNKMFNALATEIMQDLTSKIYDVKDEEEVVIAGEIPANQGTIVL